MYSVYEGKKANYRKDEIATSQGDMRRLWRTLHSALGDKTDGETGAPHRRRICDLSKLPSGATAYLHPRHRDSDHLTLTK